MTISELPTNVSSEPVIQLFNGTQKLSEIEHAFLCVYRVDSFSLPSRGTNRFKYTERVPANTCDIVYDFFSVQHQLLTMLG